MDESGLFFFPDFFFLFFLNSVIQRSLQELEGCHLKKKKKKKDAEFSNIKRNPVLTAV